MKEWRDLRIRTYANLVDILSRSLLTMSNIRLSSDEKQRNELWDELAGLRNEEMRIVSEAQLMSCDKFRDGLREHVFTMYTLRPVGPIPQLGVSEVDAEAQRRAGENRFLFKSFSQVVDYRSKVLKLGRQELGVSPMLNTDDSLKFTWAGSTRRVGVAGGRT